MMTYVFFCLNDTATTEIYTLSLHAALPISSWACSCASRKPARPPSGSDPAASTPASASAASNCRCASRVQAGRVSHRSEEHTSELQSRQYLVCRLLLVKTKIIQIRTSYLPI